MNSDFKDLSNRKLYLINLRHSFEASLHTSFIMCAILCPIIILFGDIDAFRWSNFIGHLIGAVGFGMFGAVMGTAIGMVLSFPALCFIYAPICAVLLKRNASRKAYMLCAVLVASITPVIYYYAMLLEFGFFVFIELFFILTAPVMGWLHYKNMHAHFEKYPPK